MSERQDPPPVPRRTNARSRRSRWPGWIWAVPIAAVGIVTWLLVRTFSDRGVDVSVTFDEAAGMKARDTKVTYRGLEIGKVTGVELTQDRKRVLAHLDIDKAAKDDLTAGTRFYLEGAQLSFSDPSSLKALVAGPSILMIAGTGAPSRHFSGTVGEPPEIFATTIPYVVKFDGNVGKVKQGAPVTLRGFTVGKVIHVDLTTDPQAGEITTSVTLALDPTRFHVEGLPDAVAVPDAAADEGLTRTLAKLVDHGLRATLTQSPPLLGSEQVELVVAPRAPPAQLVTTGRYPEIPAESGGLPELIAQLGQVPVAQIGTNVRAITEQIKRLTSSPQLRESLQHLDGTLAELERTVKAAGPQVAPALQSIRATTDSLRHTAAEIDGTAEAARKLLGGSAASPNGNLQQAVYELTGTARAIRTLANFLDQHPEALLRGRGSGPNEVAP